MLFGTTNSAFQLLKSYLRDRWKKCEVNGVISKGNTVKCGVPQGSILGLLFFLLHINDLASCLNTTKPRMFADDTNIAASGKCINEDENTVNSDLENLRKWLMANKLSLNVAITEFQLIGTEQNLKNLLDQKPNIHVVDRPIKKVFKCKTLGV